MIHPKLASSAGHRRPNLREHQFSYSMPFNKSRPTRLFSSGHDAPSVQGKLESSSTVDADEQWTGRKSLQLSNATPDAVYNVFKGQLEQGTVSCPDLTEVAYDGNNVCVASRQQAKLKY